MANHVTRGGCETKFSVSVAWRISLAGYNSYAQLKTKSGQWSVLKAQNEYFLFLIKRAP